MLKLIFSICFFFHSRMRSQLKLVYLLIGIVVCVVQAGNTAEPNIKDNEILKDDIKVIKKESKLLAAQDPRLNKMIQFPKDNQIDGTVKAEKKKSSTEKASLKDDAISKSDFISVLIGCKLLTFLLLSYFLSIQE